MKLKKNSHIEPSLYGTSKIIVDGFVDEPFQWLIYIVGGSYSFIPPPQSIHHLDVCLIVLMVLLDLPKLLVLSLDQ